MPLPPLKSWSETTSLILVLTLLAGCASPTVRRAERLAEEGEWDKAVVVYRDALKTDPFDEALKEKLEAAKQQAAVPHYTNGRRALEERRIADALTEFKAALGLDPTKVDHHTGMADALRLKEANDQLHTADKLLNLGRSEEALTAYERAVELDPHLTQALTHITEITAQQRSTKMFGGSSQPISLRFQNAKLKEVFEIVARTAGLNVIFDKEVRDEPITIFLKEMAFDDALNLILNTNGMVAQRVAPETLLIMPNNKQKQAQYQDLLMRTYYLNNAKAKDAVNLLRTMLESKHIYVDEKVNAIVVREEPVKLQLAEKLLFAIDRREPEVELDVEVLEVNRTKSLKYGLNYAKQAGTGLVPTGGSGGISTATTQFTYQQLTSIGPQSYLFTLPASVILDFFKQESDAQTLASPKLRVMNNKSASINVGDKQPILLSTTNVLPGQAATGAVPTTSTVTSIEFKDVGVKLTVEPTINLMNEVMMKIKVEVTRLGDQVTLQAAPEIKQFKFGTRTAETVLMLKDDETVVLAGLIQDEKRKTKSTIPLIGDIPILGDILTSKQDDRVSTEVVLTITPRVVRNMDLPSSAAQAFWSGTENTFATSQLYAPQAIPVSQSPGQSQRPHPAPSSLGSRPDMPAVPPGSGAPATDTGLTAGAGSLHEALPPSGLPTVPNGQGTVPETTGSAGDLVARATGSLVLRPLDLSAAVGQEFRVDLTALHLEQISEISVTVTFDPKLLEFHRVTPGMVALASRTADGQIMLTLRRDGAVPSGEGLLAMLFFQAKAPGQIPLDLQMLPGKASTAGTDVTGTSRAIIRAR